MDTDGNNSNILFPDGLITGLIEDESGQSSIELSSTKINFETPALCLNGVPIGVGSGVTNPLDANLATAGFDITGVGSSGLLNLNASLDKVVNIASVVAGVETQFTGQVEASGKGIFNAGISASGVSNDITGTLSMFSDIQMTSNDIKSIGSCESTTYKEGGVSGELLKKNNTTTIYAGTDAGAVLSTSDDSLLIGDESGIVLVSGNANVGLGHHTLHKITSERYNTAVGAYASEWGASGIGDGNISVGFSAMRAATNSNNNNICIGTECAYSLDATQTSTMVGYQCNDSASLSLTQGVCLGANSYNFDTSTNNIVIGASVTGTKSNQAMIGNASLNEIVNMGDGVCDIGSTTNKFKDGYFSGDVTAVTVNGVDLTNVTDNVVDISSLQLTTDNVAPRGLADD